MIGIENRCAVVRMGDNGVRRAGLDAIVTCCSSVEKNRLFHCTGRAQPVETNRSRGLLFVEAICLFDERLRGFDGGENRILQKIPPTV